MKDSSRAIARETERRWSWLGVSFPRPPESQDEALMPVRIARSLGKRCLGAGKPLPGSYEVERVWGRAGTPPDNVPLPPPTRPSRKAHRRDRYEHRQDEDQLAQPVDTPELPRRVSRAAPGKCPSYSGPSPTCHR